PAHTGARSRTQAGNDRDPLVERRVHELPRAPQPGFLEARRYCEQSLLAGDELLESEATPVIRGRGDHQDSHRPGLEALAGRETANPCHLGCGLARELFEVLDGDSARPGAKQDRSTLLRVLELLAVDPAARCLSVLDAGHVRDGGFQHGDRSATDVAATPATRRVGTN